MAKGVDDTDAVNVAQLKDVERKITNIDSNVINQARTYTDGQVAKVGAGAAALAGLHPLDYNPMISGALALVLVIIKMRKQRH